MKVILTSEGSQKVTSVFLTSKSTSEGSHKSLLTSEGSPQSQVKVVMESSNK